MSKHIKNPVIPRGLGRKLKKEVADNMPLPTRRFYCHAEIKGFEKASRDGKNGLLIQGYASTRDLDRTGEIVEPTAFSDALGEYMTNPIVTYMHDWSNPIGKTLEAKIDETGLWVKVFISNVAGQVAKLIEEGILRAFSIGYEVIEEKAIEKIIHILKLRLYEIAVVSIPANQRSLFSLAKALERGTDLVLTDDEIRRQVKENPDLRAELKGEIEAEFKQQAEACEMWRNASNAINDACDIQRRMDDEDEQVLSAVAIAVGEVRELIESGQL